MAKIDEFYIGQIQKPFYLKSTVILNNVSERNTRNKSNTSGKYFTDGKYLYSSSKEPYRYSRIEIRDNLGNLIETNLPKKLNSNYCLPSYKTTIKTVLFNGIGLLSDKEKLKFKYGDLKIKVNDDEIIVSDIEKNNNYNDTLDRTQYDNTSNEFATCMDYTKINEQNIYYDKNVSTYNISFNVSEINSDDIGENVKKSIYTNDTVTFYDDINFNVDIGLWGETVHDTTTYIATTAKYTINSTKGETSDGVRYYLCNDNFIDYINRYPSTNFFEQLMPCFPHTRVISANGSEEEGYTDIKSDFGGNIGYEILDERYKYEKPYNLFFKFMGDNSGYAFYDDNKIKYNSLYGLTNEYYYFGINNNIINKKIDGVHNVIVKEINPKIGGTYETIDCFVSYKPDYNYCSGKNNHKDVKSFITCYPGAGVKDILPGILYYGINDNGKINFTYYGDIWGDDEEEEDEEGNKKIYNGFPGVVNLEPDLSNKWFIVGIYDPLTNLSSAEKDSESEEESIYLVESGKFGYPNQTGYIKPFTNFVSIIKIYYPN